MDHFPVSVISLGECFVDSFTFFVQPVSKLFSYSKYICQYNFFRSRYDVITFSFSGWMVIRVFSWSIFHSTGKSSLVNEEILCIFCVSVYWKLVFQVIKWLRMITDNLFVSTLTISHVSHWPWFSSQRLMLQTDWITQSDYIKYFVIWYEYRSNFPQNLLSPTLCCKFHCV